MNASEYLSSVGRTRAPASEMSSSAPSSLPVGSQRAQARTGFLRSSLDALKRAFKPANPINNRVMYSRAGFAALGDRLLQDARTHGRPVAMAVFDFADLAEAQNIYDAATFHDLLRAALDKLFAVAGTTGLVAHTEATEFTVMLPGMNRQQAQQAIYKAMGKPPRVEFNAGRWGDVLLVPDVEIENAGPDIEHVQELHDELRYDLDEASAYQRQYLEHIARERARVSQPMPLRDRTPYESVSVPGMADPQPATMNVPLMAR